MEQSRAIAERLKALMKEKGLSYNELAERCNMPVRRIYRMASMGASNPGIFTMCRICEGLGVTLDEFMGTEQMQEAIKIAKF